MPIGRLSRMSSRSLRRSVARPWLTSCVVALATAAASSTLSAALVLNIDTAAKNFYLTGSDTGNAQVDPGFFPGDPVSYSVQFIHYFATNALSASGQLAPSTAGLFTEGVGGFSGSMSAYNNQFGPDYVFMDIFSYAGDITTLTGAGASSAVSYASVPTGDMSGFESMIGSTMGLTVGSGYSWISVQAVPEPSTCALGLAGLACGGYTLARRRRSR